MEAKEKLIKARVRLQEQNPFFSYLVLNLKFIEDKRVATAGVNAIGEMYYNPEFIDKLKLNELITLITHEVMHVALLHLTRLGKREAEIFNIACDIVVNNSLITNNFVFSGELQKGIIPQNDEILLFDKIHISKISEKVVEEVYNELYDKLKKNKMLKKIKELFSFDEHHYSVNDKQEQEAHEKEWKKKLIEAQTFAKMQGKEPLGLGRYIDKLIDSKLDWKQLLYRYLTQEIMVDYSYNRPSRRSQVLGVYMPRVVKEMVDIVVAVDVSGSIGKEELTEFFSEIYSIGKSFNALRMNLIFIDTEVNNHYVLNNYEIDDILKYEIKGGGGTDFSKIYDYTSENIPNAKLVVFFTDAYASFPKHEEIKTLWIVNKGGNNLDKIPFGEKIRLE